MIQCLQKLIKCGLLAPKSLRSFYKTSDWEELSVRSTPDKHLGCRVRFLALSQLVEAHPHPACYLQHQGEAWVKNDGES